ncbi:hypothetical protein GCM10009069_08160 [Algimonas arctica]|uniref:Uncharacterized protein n=1 Tax=Algimonas arctica TaxID=1479486 RepID=A0A8J3CQR2_9PROT|nr:hypothetical protein [Algimonas arctica]GHA87221.1 hypothetical protein GCM10009069_08160 [Algimonas arctica]
MQSLKKDDKNQEVVVTQAMIEAGVDVLTYHLPDALDGWPASSLERIVKLVYDDMVAKI